MGAPPQREGAGGAAGHQFNFGAQIGGGGEGAAPKPSPSSPPLPHIGVCGRSDVKGGGGERDRKWDPPHQNTVKPHRESDDPRKNRSPSPSLLPLPPPPGFQEGRGPTKPPPPPQKKEIHNKAEVCLAASSAVSHSHSWHWGGGDPPPSRACLDVPGWALMWSYGGGFLFGGGGRGRWERGKGGGRSLGVCSPGVQYQLLSGLGSLWREVFMVSRYSCCDTASTDARISSSSQSLRPEMGGEEMNWGGGCHKN